MLVSRLRICAWRKARPVTSPIVAPLVGTGLPRSGTSFLHGLLAQDADNLVALTAEALVPVPPPGSSQRERRRHALADRLLAFQGLAAPEVNEIHPHRAIKADEDLLLQEAACGSLYQGFFNVPGFIRSLTDDVASLYRWQKGLMEILQSNRPGKRWVLKAPAHMTNLTVLLETFPDASLFVNHRDPARVIPSLASLYLRFRGLNTPCTPDPKVLGRAVLAAQAAAVRHMSAWRDAHPHVGIVDVQYSDLVRDPIGQAERLYGALGLTLSASTKQSMGRYLRNQDDSRGHDGSKHLYALTDFGLSDRMIDEAFADYIARYRVSREPPPS